MQAEWSPGPGIAFFLALGLALASACSSGGAAGSTYPRATPPRTLAVVAAPSEVEDEVWRDVRLGFGLASLVAEELHRTGRFVLVEERPEIRQKLALARDRIWKAGVAGAEPASLAGIGSDLGVEAVASGRVVSFSSPRSRVHAGPFGVRTNTVEVAVRVCVQDRVLGREYCAEGAGEATTRANEAFFEYRAEGVVFDQTTVGAATAEAVRVAVARLMGER